MQSKFRTSIEQIRDTILRHLKQPASRESVEHQIGGGIAMRRVLDTCAVVVCVGWLAEAALCQEIGDPDVAAIVAGNNEFAFDLYRTLANTTDGNLFFSPYSISTALTMTDVVNRDDDGQLQRHQCEFARVLGYRWRVDAA